MLGQGAAKLGAQKYVKNRLEMLQRLLKRHGPLVWRSCDAELLSCWDDFANWYAAGDAPPYMSKDGKRVVGLPFLNLMVALGKGHARTSRQWCLQEFAGMPAKAKKPEAANFAYF